MIEMVSASFASSVIVLQLGKAVNMVKRVREQQVKLLNIKMYE